MVRFDVGHPGYQFCFYDLCLLNKIGDGVLFLSTKRFVLFNYRKMFANKYFLTHSGTAYILL